MKILVVGGCGFIGSNLVRKLARDKKNSVWVYDNLYLGTESYLPKNIINFASPPNFYPTFDIIYHLGNYSSAPMYELNTAERINQTISDFTFWIDKAARDKSKFIYASSSSINGPPTYYSLTRITFEEIAKTYYSEKGFKSVGLRFFSVFGPREEHKDNYANLISQAIWANLAGSAFTIYGDGKQKRDFIYIDDVVNALISAIDVTEKMVADVKDNMDWGYYRFDVGTGTNYSLNEILSKIHDASGKPIKTKKIANPIKNYVECTLATPSLFLPGWTPKTTINKGIANTIKYYRRIWQKWKN